MIEYRSLAEMVSDIADIVGDRSTTVQAKYKTMINRHYANIAREIDWPYLLRGKEEELSIVQGQAYLYLPKDVDHIKVIKIDNMPGIPPHEMIETLLERSGESFRTTGAIYEWADAGELGRKTEFHTSAEQISIASSVSANTSTLTIVGRINDDDDVSEEVSLPGNPTGVTSTNSFSDIHFVSSDKTHTGVLTVSGATSAKTYATISPGEATAKYKRIRLLFIPSTGPLYTIYYKKRIIPLIRDSQVPEIPVSHYLTVKTIADHFAGRRLQSTLHSQYDQQAQLIKAQLEAEVKQQGQRIEQSMPIVDTQHYGYARRYGGPGFVVIP